MFLLMLLEIFRDYAGRCRTLSQIFVATKGVQKMLLCAGVQAGIFQREAEILKKYFALTKVRATLFTITFMSYMLFQF